MQKEDYNMAIFSITLKIIAILCMLVFIIFSLMVLGLIPGKRFIKFLNKHKTVQAIFAIILGIGLISAFIAVI